MFLGGSEAHFVGAEDNFDFAKLTSIVFKWGDPRASDVFAQAFEHSLELSDLQILPLAPVAVIASRMWHLALQDKGFNPAYAHESTARYLILPYEIPADESILEATIAGAHQEHRQVLGKVASRYVLFELGLSL